MDEIIVVSAFFGLTMVLFMVFCLYMVRLFLGITGSKLPESAESPFNPVNTGGAEVQDYLDKLGGNRFTEPTTFDMPKRGFTLADDPAPEGFATTDQSEIPVM